MDTTVAATPDSIEFYSIAERTWEPLTPRAPSPGLEKDVEQDQQNEADRAKRARRALSDQLLAALQMQHLVVLAGSGTSLGKAGGPSMPDLWKECVAPTATPDADSIQEAVGYANSGEQNIEALLSQCEAFLQCNSGNTLVEGFVSRSRAAILTRCSTFINPNTPEQLAAHRTFLHRLSRRRVRDSRLKLFTTNYDLCFEAAAGRQGLVAIDGFSFTEPRHFDPRFLQYDIVRRTPITGETGTPLEGVFQLFKLHGSVNWERDGENVTIKTTPDADKACIIYPAKGKYQQSYLQPHLELVSQFFAALREPNTCLLVIGFGFKDDHLSEPILAAVKTNPHLKVVVVSPSARADATETDSKKRNKYWSSWYNLANEGYDILLIAATFSSFANHIPDLKSLSPAEQLAKSVAALGGGR